MTQPIEPIPSLIHELNKLPVDKKGDKSLNRKIQRLATEILQNPQKYTISVEEYKQLKDRFLEIHNGGGFKRFFFKSETERVLEKLVNFLDKDYRTSISDFFKEIGGELKNNADPAQAINKLKGLFENYPAPAGLPHFELRNLLRRNKKLIHSQFFVNFANSLKNQELTNLIHEIKKANLK